MGYLKSFIDFCNTAKERGRYRITSKGRIKRVSWDVITIAKNYVDVINIFLKSSSSNGVKLEITIISYNRKIQEEVIIEVLHTGKINIDQREFFESVQTILVVGHENEALRLFERYIEFCIESYINENPCFLAKCGWLPLEKGKAFLSVNYCKSVYPDIVDDLFNGYLKRSLTQELCLETFAEDILIDFKEVQSNFKKVNTDFEEFCSRKDNLEKLFSLILNDPCMFTVFSYSIHSFFWDYLRSYDISRFEMEEISNKHSVIFSLCIYGKDTRISKIIANLLANFFNISSNKWATINKKYHISSTSLSQEKIDRLIRYKSVPIIVTSKTNHFTRTSSIIRKLHQKRKDSQIHCYPVYISTSPVTADEVLNCCSDISLEKLNQITYDVLDEIHDQFCYLIYHFICHLTKISNQDIFPNREDEQYFMFNVYELIKNLRLTEEWLDNHVPDYLLYSTIDCFCRYLKSTPLCLYADKLKAFSEVCFLPNKKEEKQSKLLGNSQKEVECLRFLYLFIQKNLKPGNETWIWEGQETRGEKENCYYLHSEDGYDAFKNFFTKKTTSVISKEKFKEILKKYEILKMPKSGSSNTMKRKNKYVLILIKDKLNHFADSDSI